ncbi:MFS general substrate transporter, partial [Rhizoctonia solani]
MSGPEAPIYITEDAPQTIVPVTSHAGDEVSGPPQRQAAQDIDRKAIQNTPQSALLDIEHQPVDDDPRLWSKNRKITIVAIIAFATLAPTFSVNLYNPAFAQIKKELHATNGQIALSLALFILVQGNAPIIWSAVSEIKGRKIVYIVSMLLFCIGSAICGAAKDMKVLIGMRIVQAAGSSSVLNLGAGTLSDMYDPHERGTMMGIYFAGVRSKHTNFSLCIKPNTAPFAFGTLVALVRAKYCGGLTAGFSWRATFWFLVIFAGVSLGTFVFLPDTWRRERSTSYQAAKQRALKERAKRSQAGTPTWSRAPSPTRSGTVTPIIGANTPTDLTQGYEDKKKAQEQVANAATTVVKSEKHGVQDEDIKLSITDVNPISPIWHILKERSNLCILFASALLFAYQYAVAFTAALTFAGEPYNYNSIKVGLVLLSFGLGNLSGSILGGRWSDRVLGQLKAKNGGESVPEMRLQSTRPALIFLPFFVIAYAWMCEKHVNIAGPVVVLFFSGFCAIWIYSSTLAYIVDSNPGRASSAIATNSSFRGISGLIAAEISVPLKVRWPYPTYLSRLIDFGMGACVCEKNALGDGGLYTLWAGLLVICEALIILLIWRGGKWRAARQQGLPV